MLSVKCLTNLLKSTCSSSRSSREICSRKVRDQLLKVILALNQYLLSTWIRLKWSSITFSSSRVQRSNPQEAIPSGHLDQLVVPLIKLLLMVTETLRQLLFRSVNLALTSSLLPETPSSQLLKSWEICWLDQTKPPLATPLQVSQSRSHPLRPQVTSSSKFCSKKKLLYSLQKPHLMTI